MSQIDQVKMEVFEDGEFDFQFDMKNAFSNYELLDSIYTPVRVYEALIYFINNAHMDIIHDDKVINILDFSEIKSMSKKYIDNFNDVILQNEWIVGC